MAYDEFIAAVITRLSAIAPSARGTSSIPEGQTTDAPRFVFVWKHVGVAPANKWIRSQSSRNNPAPISVDQHDVEVHIWAKDVVSLETLRASVLVAVRAELKGRRYDDGGMLPGDDNPARVKEGIKGVMALRVYLEAPRLVLDATPAATPGTDPTAHAKPATLPTVTPTEIDEKDTSGSIPSTFGDGIIDLGEP